ncbi:MAG: hypothetical protein ACT4OS_08335 [Acidimicrobiales bacterium]
MPPGPLAAALMNRLDELIARGSCSACGQGVFMDNSIGRVACKGCNLVTEECTCSEAQPLDKVLPF